MKKLILMIGFIACLRPVICLAQYTDKEALAIIKLENQLKADLATDALNGSISVAVMKNDKVIWAKAYGYANRDSKKLADTATIYRIASITKTFTSTLLMLLVEDKVVNLDDPAEKYVPEVADIIGYNKDTKFTLRQLASHTSGLKRDANMYSGNVGPSTAWNKKLLTALPSIQFDSKPGKQWLYSNVGVCILGLALERAAGKPYLQMINERIINPLHMTHTFFAPDDANIPKVAQGIYNREGVVNTRLPIAQQQGLGYGAPGGGLFSTPADLAKFVGTFFTQQGLLSKASIREMHITPKGGKDYGLGLTVDPRSDINLVGHNGLIPGYASQFMIEEDSKYAVIIMRNYDVGVTNVFLAAARFLEGI